MKDPFSATWLADLESKALDALRQAATPVDYPRGGIIYALGLPQQSLWGVQSGQVRVMVGTNEMPQVLGHIHAPGAWFGEVELLLPIEAYVQMEAVPDTSVVRVDGRAFRNAADQFPALWECVAKLASLNLWFATSAANDLALRTPRKRIAATLLRLAGQRAATQQALPLQSIRASQQEIADLSNVARTTASKLLLDFQDADVIRLEYGRISVLDPERLQQILAD